MAGLDPATPRAHVCACGGFFHFRMRKLDGRLKGGHDGEVNYPTPFALNQASMRDQASFAAFSL